MLGRIVPQFCTLGVFVRKAETPHLAPRGPEEEAAPGPETAWRQAWAWRSPGQGCTSARPRPAVSSLGPGFDSKVVVREGRRGERGGFAAPPDLRPGGAVSPPTPAATPLTECRGCRRPRMAQVFADPELPRVLQEQQPPRPQSTPPIIRTQRDLPVGNMQMEPTPSPVLGWGTATQALRGGGSQGQETRSPNLPFTHLITRAPNGSAGWN